MACFYPVKAWKSHYVNPETGKRGITFSISKAYTDLHITLPCGQCIGCRIHKSQMWAIRCKHEMQMHEHNCFITLTYDENSLPSPETLLLRDFQLFMKRLRNQNGAGIRFFHCGEYGDKLARPHYHAIIFGHDFHDKILWKMIKGNPCYISETLTSLWGMGHCTLAEANFQTAGYISRYIMKKVTGKLADSHYEAFHPETGEIYWKKSEYITMSKKPGLGLTWFEKYKSDIYPGDYVVIEGKKKRVPQYYDYLLKNSPDHLDTALHDSLKLTRTRASIPHKWNNTPGRLRVREIVTQSKIKQLTRTIHTPEGT